jgi:hypothetical protein
MFLNSSHFTLSTATQASFFPYEKKKGEGVVDKSSKKDKF